MAVISLEILVDPFVLNRSNDAGKVTSRRIQHLAVGLENEPIYSCFLSMRAFLWLYWDTLRIHSALNGKIWPYEV